MKLFLRGHVFLGIGFWWNEGSRNEILSMMIERQAASKTSKSRIPNVYWLRGAVCCRDRSMEQGKQKRKRMFRWSEKWVPAQHLSDDRSRRKGKLLVLFYLATAVFLVAFAFLYLSIDYRLGVGACLYGAVVVPVLLFIFYRTGSFAATTGVFDMNAILMFSLLIYGTGGIHSSIVPWLAIVPASGFVFQGWKRGMLMSVLCLLEIVVLFALEINGVHLPNLYNLDYQLMLNFLVQAGLLAYIFMILMIYEGSRERTIRRLDKLNTHLEQGKQELEQQRAALEESNAHILNLNTNLEAIVASRTAKLEEAKKELDTFLYEAAHALRRPTARILGLVAILREEKDAAVAEAMQNHVDTSAHLMDQILHKLIAVSELNSRELHLEPLDLTDVMRPVQESLPDDPEVRELELGIAVRPGIKVLADRFLLELALRFVVENAIQYTAKTGRKPLIRLEASEDEGWVELHVTDNGIGIPASELGRVTEMFFRATEKFPGGGLGLYVANKAIDRLGGMLDLQSEMSVGTTVSLRLPVV